MPVYESDDPARDCERKDDIGCFCESVGCATIILLSCSPLDAKCLELQGTAAIHEYVHASYASFGVDTRDHGEAFEEALKIARQTFAKTSAQ